jgi:hypothetical protein
MARPCEVDSKIIRLFHEKLESIPGLEAEMAPRPPPTPPSPRSQQRLNQAAQDILDDLENCTQSGNEDEDKAEVEAEAEEKKTEVSSLDKEGKDSEHRPEDKCRKSRL